MPSFDRPRQPDVAPSPWVLRFAHLLRSGGRVLDLAAGHGRHTRWLLGGGFAVTAADVDVSGLSDLAGNPRLEILEADLESVPWPFKGRRFAGIVITNYLHRPHFSVLPQGLEPGGVLLWETFGAGNARWGRPRNPDLLLAPGELLDAFAGRLQVVAYEHGFESLPRPAVRQRICAVAPMTGSVAPGTEDVVPALSPAPPPEPESAA